VLGIRTEQKFFDPGPLSNADDQLFNISFCGILNQGFAGVHFKS
jgi:hypothetical protein